ncbi:lytic transglycosylase domain-containing protein (plasmid) [Tistrella mobilis]|uniref:Transglycosylase SLT domain-containing protein n=1 Tax=Tistrella mobilis TaxID=171437 RepID=A0A162KL20_9PROT|nr:lytic transglycosylase domain-containing protein [Tistrella mobilis]KYO51534.1 hypothetical protein AUP44_08425 [Tistrella mobilis]
MRGLMFVLALLLVLPAAARAETGCFARAARLAGVEADVLVALAWVESRWRPGAVNDGNRNGSEDVCLMQVNSVHYERLARIGIDRDRLLQDWCVCLLVGAEILAEMRAATGGDLRDALAAYNAGPGNLAAGRRHADEVLRVLTRLRRWRAGPTIGSAPAREKIRSEDSTQPHVGQPPRYASGGD